MLMFANFPVLGITQGFVPIVGYNYGARNKLRVKQIIRISILSATVISFGIFILLLFFAPSIASIFTKEQSLIADATPAIRIVFAATPLLAFSLILSALYQATGHTVPALLLALTKQGFFLIPLVLLLPLFFGVNGIWAAFPLADVGAALTAVVYYKVKRVQYRDVPVAEELSEVSV
jgi:Na+-driven multidrug efflux pump